MEEKGAKEAELENLRGNEWRHLWEWLLDTIVGVACLTGIHAVRQCMARRLNVKMKVKAKASPRVATRRAAFDKALKEEEDEEDSLVGLVSVSTSVTPTPDSRRRQKALEAFALLEA